jgi:serine/threonine protein phosphatase PrpC
MRAVAWGLTDVGLQREHNEDSFVVLKEFDLYVVADGMGGHRAGDVASKLATDTISEFFRSTAQDDVTWPFHFDANLSEEENRLLTGIRVANRQIFERSTRSREYHGMGTTVVGAMFSPRKGRMYIGHVGDSRCYRIRGGQIQLLTRDHSLFNDYLLAMPDLTEEQRKELPKNVITRALGMQDQVAVDLQNDESQAGDVYVLCSDGLSGMITDEEILAVVQGAAPDSMQEAPKQLIQRANERGGEDNVTAVVIAIEDDSAVESTGEAHAITAEAAVMSTRSATAATEVPPPGSPQPPVEVAPIATPTVPAPPDPSEFGDEPTMPAIDLAAAEKDKELGDEPTMPAIDLAKELEQTKKPQP